MKRAEFLARARQLLDDMEQDHEEHTGVTATDEMSFGQWMIEIESAHENTK